MAWELVFDQKAAKQLETLPARIRPELESEFVALAADPQGHARQPAMFAHEGACYSFQVRDKEAGLIVVTIRFYFDDNPNVKKLHVHTLEVISPCYEGSVHPANTSTDPIDIPHR